MKTLAFSCGDINGIGPEIIIKFLSNPGFTDRVIIPIPVSVFEKALSLTGNPLQYNVISTNAEISGKINIIDIPVDNFTPGKPTVQSGEICYDSICRCYDLVKNNIASAIVTAPISKTSLGLAGIDFPGHTEMFQQWAGTKYPLMTFLSDSLKCALVTIHEPVNEVSKLITGDRLSFIFENFISMFINDLGIKEPRIAVLGLNPHAGEDGRIGVEEVNVIKPVIEQFKNVLSGPFVPDAFFGNKTYCKFDGFVAMYHDQGLIPFKMANFNEGVNYTAGLPFVRTSPDHGTAFDIAWQNKADYSSFTEAVKWALLILENRSRK